MLLMWWPTALTLAVVLYATLWPDPTGDVSMVWFPGADKLIHAVMMGGLASAVLFDRRRSGRILTRRFIAGVAIGTIAFSVLDEFGQGLMNLGRTTEALDFFANAGGVVLGCLLATPVINRIFKKSKPDY